MFEFVNYTITLMLAMAAFLWLAGVSAWEFLWS